MTQVAVFAGVWVEPADQYPRRCYAELPGQAPVQHRHGFNQAFVRDRRWNCGQGQMRRQQGHAQRVAHQQHHGSGGAGELGQIFSVP